MLDTLKEFLESKVDTKKKRSMKNMILPKRE